MSSDRRKDTRRVNDNQVKWITEQFQDLKHEFVQIKDLFAHKFDNGVNKKFEDILTILNKLPCEIHLLKIDGIDGNIKEHIEDTKESKKDNRHLITGLVVGLICSIPAFIDMGIKIVKSIFH